MKKAEATLLSILKHPNQRHESLLDVEEPQDKIEKKSKKLLRSSITQCNKRKNKFFPIHLLDMSRYGAIRKKIAQHCNL
ncbi:hypothetical protein BpHYR1_002855 [Brachionus plicatilis]|uniref:Uncharacterized protein n=1 Tax=Brachionus plicatilis TaxID=10195 RepID=A0A3M7QXI0_BRAPC|nr:hypothetical protein BpHYR1_002855 [Brachionus plicatilis]